MEISIASVTLSYLHFYILALLSKHPMKTQDPVPLPNLEIEHMDPRQCGLTAALTSAPSCWMGHMPGTGAERDAVFTVEESTWEDGGCLIQGSTRKRYQGSRQDPAWPWRPWGSISPVHYELPPEPGFRGAVSLWNVSSYRFLMHWSISESPESPATKIPV